MARGLGPPGRWLQPCHAPNPALIVPYFADEISERNHLSSILADQRTTSYFAIMGYDSWVGAGPNVFKLRGVHRVYSDWDHYCLECILTGTKFDVRGDRWKIAFAEGPWERINSPLEVLAWQGQ